MNMHFDIPAIQIAGGSSFSSLDVSHIVVTVTDKIDSFAALQKGWDYGAGEPIPTDRTRAAKVWVSFLEFLGFSNLDASPGSCSSSDNLRPIRHFENGGSGSSGVRV
jgi:hypothetical protein